jgi:hypothetical protein
MLWPTCDLCRRWRVFSTVISPEMELPATPRNLRFQPVQLRPSNRLVNRHSIKGMAATPRSCRDLGFDSLL